MDSAANDELTGLGDGVLLTSDLLMDRLGVYDLMTTKEVQRPAFRGCVGSLTIALS